MEDEALAIIAHHAHAGACLREEFFRSEAANLRTAAQHMAASLACGGKVLLCGHGGSAPVARLLAAAFVHRLRMDRPALPALALSTDNSTFTAPLAHTDVGSIYARQVEAFGKAGDIFVVLSASLASAETVQAVETAHSQGMLSVGLCGAGDGNLTGLCHTVLTVPTEHEPLIQEIHVAAGHLLCRLTDYYLFENVTALAPCLNLTDDKSSTKED